MVIGNYSKVIGCFIIDIKSVSDNCTVVGIPAKIIKTNIIPEDYV